MFWNKYLLPSLVSLLVMATLHVIFIHFYIYWRVRWIDIPIHMLAGIWIVLTLAWVLGWLAPQMEITLARAVIWGLIIGGLWEIGELALAIVSPLWHGYIADAIKDLSDDVIGAVFGYFIVKWIAKEKIQKQ